MKKKLLFEDSINSCNLDIACTKKDIEIINSKIELLKFGQKINEADYISIKKHLKMIYTLITLFSFIFSTSCFAISKSIGLLPLNGTNLTTFWLNFLIVLEVGIPTIYTLISSEQFLSLLEFKEIKKLKIVLSEKVELVTYFEKNKTEIDKLIDLIISQEEVKISDIKIDDIYYPENTENITVSNEKEKILKKIK